MSTLPDQESRPPARTSPLVSAVIVNDNNWPDVLRLVADLTAARSFASGTCEVVVVDNGSRGPVPVGFTPPRPGVRFIARRENGGFAAGVNAGWRKTRTPWLLLLNPDVILGAGQLDRIAARAAGFEADPGRAPGVVGFALRNADGSRQPSVGVFPTLARTFREQLIPRSRRKYQAGWRIRPGIVDWVKGACMLVNARLLDVLGGLDEDFFLCYEEVALCRMAHRLGWRVEYDPGVEATHLHPLQLRPIPPALQLVARHSKLIYFRKHLPYWQFSVLSWMICWEAGLRGAWGWVRRRPEEVRIWRSIGIISRMLWAGFELGGKEVRARAEEAAAPGPGCGEPPAPRPDVGRPGGHVRPGRKGGPA